MRRLLFVLCLFSGSVFSADYSWYYGTYTGSSPDAVARAYVTATWGSSQAYYWQSKSDTDWVLGVTGKSYDNHVKRTGTGCTSPAVYDSTSGSCLVSSDFDGQYCNGSTAATGSPYIWSSGQCVFYPSASQSALCKFFGYRGTTVSLVTSFDSAQTGPLNGNVAADEKTGCAFTIQTSSCKTSANGKGISCNLTGTYTGALGVGGSALGPENCSSLQGCTTPVDTTPQKLETNNPCVYAGSAGNLSCTSSTKDETTGVQNCGTFNGTYGCTWASPTSKGIDIATNIVTTSNADGTSTAVKTDTSTKTVCTDMNACVVSVTKTVTTTSKDGQGNVTSAKSTCTGAACGTGSGTNGTGTGSGGTGTAESGTCVTADECSDGSSATTPKLTDVDDYQTTTQKFYDSVKGSPIANAVGSISAPDGGTPPNLTTAPIQALGGKSLDFGVIRDLKGTIDSVLQLTMKAVWCLAAIVIFLMA